MSNFTPGPWEISRLATPDYAPQYAIHNGGRNDFCIVKDENSKANARLIVAAPDLLAACTKAHDALLALHVCDQDRPFADETRAFLSDAIAKATE